MAKKKKDEEEEPEEVKAPEVLEPEKPRGAGTGPGGSAP